MCYERPMGIASTSRLIFKLCLNPISTPSLSIIIQSDQNRFNRSRNEIIDRKKRVIKVVNDQKGFCNYLFLVQKKGGCNTLL